MSECRCGCSESVAPRKSYRPGHDARHVSILLDGLKSDAEQNAESLISMNSLRVAMRELDTPALKLKLQRAVDRCNDRRLGSRTVTRPVSSEGFEYGQVRVGRWDYPARTRVNSNTQEIFPDSMERNTKRDGSGEWVPVSTS